MQQDNFTNPVPAQPEIKPLKWTLYIFVASLPLIGFIMLLIWAFGNDANKVRSNWAKGMLILFVIAIVLYFILFAIFGAAILAGLGSGEYNGY
jgi:hypothetical protein